jgi:hypothetical protein
MSILYREWRTLAPTRHPAAVQLRGGEGSQTERAASAGVSGDPDNSAQFPKMPKAARKPRRKCEHCNHEPYSGPPGRRPVRCVRHKADGDAKLRRVRCVDPGCTKGRARFYFAGQAPKHCRKHRQPDQRDVCQPQCEQCEVQATFGPPGGRKVRCGTHKDAAHVDLTNGKCEDEDCPHQPRYGSPSDGVKRRCKRHRAEGDELMVKRKMCKGALCRNGANGNNKEAAAAQLCMWHFKHGAHVARVAGASAAAKHCDHADHATPGVGRAQARYGPPGGKRHRCAAHKAPHYVDLVKKTMCKTCGKKQALWGPTHNRRQFCGRCKAADHYPAVGGCQGANCRQRASKAKDAASSSAASDWAALALASSQECDGCSALHQRCSSRCPMRWKAILITSEAVNEHLALRPSRTQPLREQQRLVSASRHKVRGGGGVANDLVTTQGGMASDKGVTVSACAAASRPSPVAANRGRRH